MYIYIDPFSRRRAHLTLSTNWLRSLLRSLSISFFLSSSALFPVLTCCYWLSSVTLFSPALYHTLWTKLSFGVTPLTRPLSFSVVYSTTANANWHIHYPSTKKILSGYVALRAFLFHFKADVLVYIILFFSSLDVIMKDLDRIQIQKVRD